MKLKNFTTQLNVPSAYALIKLAGDPQNIISVMPGVVSIKENKVRLKFRRLFFYHDSTYTISPVIQSQKMVEYKLSDDKNNTLKILLSITEKNEVTIAVSYSGEREWVVGKALDSIAKEISDGLKRELESSITVEKNHQSNYSDLLSRLSTLTKLIMKSKMVKSELVEIKEGELINYLQEVITEFQQYPVIYVSGSGQGTFRLLFINGELKGIYVIKNGEEHKGEEETLNKLSGTYKIHTYVALSPRVLEVIQ
ncbi:MAG: hypothetical protein QXU86_05190 [Metallosphaera sp.]